MDKYKPSSLVIPIGPDLDGADQWLEIGVLAAIASKSGEKYVSYSQLERLRRCTKPNAEKRYYFPAPDELVHARVICSLNGNSMLAFGGTHEPDQADAIRLQLLPKWADNAAEYGSTKETWEEFDLGKYKVYSRDSNVINSYRRSADRVKTTATRRTPLFARSANYMGSKTALSGCLLDIAESCLDNNTIVVDLMCGSGVMSGAFAASFPTIASDAQVFSRFLACVQGGGMTRERASQLAEKIVNHARGLYESLPANTRHKIEDEDRLLNSEITAEVARAEWRKIEQNAKSWATERKGSYESVLEAWTQGQLFSHLYAGVFFGERQASEIDCIRQAIDSVEDEFERSWALGALICSASACAYTYAGHFAQPRLNVVIDGKEAGKQRGDIAKACQQRALSITHEFFVRLISLAEESESVLNAVELVEGPWDRALDEIEATHSARSPVCVYLDPPYTRDEYSRYYHVLEAIALNLPQEVSGQGRLPKRGSKGRFASSFNQRKPEVAEAEIAKVISACLNKGWSCLWSYADKGTASIIEVLKLVEENASNIEMYRVKHKYQGQGRRGAKDVLEYVVYLEPVTK